MHAVVICVRTNAIALVTERPTLAEAFDFATTTVPCSPRCTGNHCVSWEESGHTRAEFPNTSRPAPLRAQLLTLYPRKHSGAAGYPAPAEYNQPFPGQRRTTRERQPAP